MREELHLGIAISNLQKNTDPERWEHHIRDRMSRELADKIYHARLRSREEIGQHATVYRMSLIVADVDEYWADVERRAYEIASRMSSLSPGVLP